MLMMMMMMMMMIIIIIIIIVMMPLPVDWELYLKELYPEVPDEVRVSEDGNVETTQKMEHNNNFYFIIIVQTYCGGSSQSGVNVC